MDYLAKWLSANGRPIKFVKGGTHLYHVFRFTICVRKEALGVYVEG